jgi:hypothetical protein
MSGDPPFSGVPQTSCRDANWLHEAPNVSNRSLDNILFLVRHNNMSYKHR